MGTLVNLRGLSPFRERGDWKNIVGDIVSFGRNPVVFEVKRTDGSIDRQITENLITNAGIDFVCAQVGGTASASAVAKYIALSSDGTPPAVGDTTLAGEIVSNGLGRALATYAHTGGTTTFTQQVQWNVTGTQNNIQKAGLFTASSAGILVFESMLAESKNVANDDTLTVTWTVTVA